jgi:hypothetical protein
MRLRRCLAALTLLAACSSQGDRAADPGQAPAPPPSPPTEPAPPLAPPPPLPPLAEDPGGGSGDFRWAFQVGGLGSDVVRDLAVAADGDVVVCGDFEKEATFGALGARTSAGKSDGFVARLDGAGAPRWVQAIGGPHEDTCDAIAITADGTIVAGGLFAKTLTFGAFTARATGSDDLWVAALKPDGTPAWLWTTGGKASDAVTGLAATPDGGVVVVGGFYGEVPFGEVRLAARAREDAFLVKLSAGGDVQWARRFGGERDARFVRVAVDGQGSIVALGAFEGTASFGGEPLVSAGGYDIAIAKYDARGEHLWSQRFGGVDNDGAVGLAVDPAGHIVLAGSYDQRLTIGAETYRARGTGDALVVRLAGDGSLTWSRTFGGKGEDIAAAVAADAAGNVVVGGWFEGEVDFGQGKVTARGNKDVFVLKLDAAGALRWAKTHGDRDHDKVRAVAIAEDGTIVVGGVFRFTLDLPVPVESVRDPADRAPKVDAFVLRLDR